MTADPTEALVLRKEVLLRGLERIKASKNWADPDRTLALKWLTLLVRAVWETEMLVDPTRIKVSLPPGWSVDRAGRPLQAVSWRTFLGAFLPWESLLWMIRADWPVGAMAYALAQPDPDGFIADVTREQAEGLSVLGGLLARGPLPGIRLA